MKGVRQRTYLQAASFGGIQDEELFEQVLAVGGHVERNPVFTAQHALSQFLVVGVGGRKKKKHGRSAAGSSKSTWSHGFISKKL